MATYILLAKGTTPVVSGAIKWITGSPYSHCAFVHGSKVYEVEPWGFDVEYLDLYRHPYDLFKIKDLNPIEETSLRIWNKSLAKKFIPYDFGKIVGLAFYFLLGIDRVRVWLDNKKRLECYEHVALGLKLIGRQVKIDQMHGAPGDLANDPLLEKVSKAEK